MPSATTDGDLRSDRSAGAPAPVDRPLLDVRDLHVEFRGDDGPVVAVDGASLSVGRGESLAVVGESGSGKSTIVASILGLLARNGRIVGGTVTFDGEDITNLPDKRMRQIRGIRIGLVPQDPMSSLNPLTRIGTQVAEALEAHGLASGRQAQGRAVELLGHVGLPDAAERARLYPHEFSGGMRQRALIAIGLACQPALLLADEPTSALDVTVQRQILDHLQRLTGELGTAVLLVTHDLGLAAERAERVVVMYRGKVVETGPSRQILTDPQHEYTRRLVSSAPSLTAVRMVASPVTVGPEHSAPEADGSAPGQVPAGQDLLVAQGLHKTYRIRGSRSGGRAVFHAVRDVSFAIPRGKTLALVGESGSGKTTTARMALRLITPTAGSITFDGHEVGSLHRGGLRPFRRRVQAVFQDPYSSLNPTASIGEILEEPLRIFRIGDRASRRATVRSLLDQVALPSTVLHRYPNELSGGQRQRVAIARALAPEPDLVVCDEPVSALDVLVQAQILDLLAELQERRGLSFLFISHDLAVVRLLAHEVAVMKSGQIVEVGPTDQMFDDPRNKYTQRLLEAIPGRSLLAS